MSGLRDALVNGLTHYNFCYAEIHASEPSVATPEEVELVAAAVLRVLAEHGDTQQVRDEIRTAVDDPGYYVDHEVAHIVAARDAAVERAERLLSALRAMTLELAAVRQQLDQLRAVADEWEHEPHDHDNSEGAPDCAACWVATIRHVLDAPARPAGHDETGQ
jgi:hypothetical protein